MGIVNKLAPNLEDNLRLAQMQTTVSHFIRNSLILAIIVAVNASIPVLLITLGTAFMLLIPVVFGVILLLFFMIFLQVPKYNINKVRAEIESDIFIPARMLLTLLESGNSLVTALEGVSYTRSKSAKYFGKIASEIYLGKNIDQAIDDGIKYTPSPSFKRVFEPIRNSLKTGTDIQKNLYSTLKDLSQEKIVEIEKYEKKLGAVSLFYMLFGTIIPSIGIVVTVIGLSILGLKIDFFPFLFILLILVFMVQVVFIRLFQGIRPLMKL